ncbi:MAG: nicotinate (nicotinamide) nucleotide adenylyltransferase [Anaerolineales bacterium]|nr:nicotinate (nicotinamide) nucleotide adenylyltransferase [Anaerolineales bacterium]
MKHALQISFEATQLRYTSPMSFKRIGVFGGTFDPPHIGHLILAAEACRQLSLERLLWVLTPVSPLKRADEITSLDQRLSMVELAIAGNPDFELSRIEIDSPGPYYTLDTIQRFADCHPSAEIVLVIGGDSLRDLPRWHRPADLVSACHEIGVMRRPGDSVDLSALERQVPGTQAKVRFVDAPLLEISSSDIRRRIREKLPFRYYLSPSVYEYILKNKLYR